jgi:membrane-bound ClpP family serine protease
VRAFSENWQARSPRPVQKGAKLRVTAIDGLVLTVEPAAGMDARGRTTLGAVVEV